jgi:hypothetical protein
VIRKILDLEQGTGGWKKVHNEELNTRDITWRRVKRTGHLGYVGELKNVGILDNLKVRKQFGFPG